MRLNDIDGEYYTSYFCIVLDTNKDPVHAMKNNRSTFAHEFIHYLQDLILPYNIRLNLSNLRWIHNTYNANVDGTIIRPFDKWDEDSRLTKLQQAYTWGGNKPIKNVWHKGDIQSELCKESGYDSYRKLSRSFDIYKYTLKVNKHKSYQLGAVDLLEYIAYKIESKHYGVGKLADLPYCSVDILFEKYNLSHVSEDIRLCIVEFCLYNDNPIHMFMQRFLQNEEFIQFSATLKYNEVYACLLNEGFQTKDNIYESIFDKTNRRLEQLEDELLSVYSSLDTMAGWVRLANRFAMEHLANRFVFSDIYKMSTEEYEAFEHFVLSEIGLPLLMNRAEKRVSLLPDSPEDSSFDQFFIACKLLSFLTSNSTSTSQNCPITRFCNENYGKYYNKCDKKLKSANTCDQGCPFAKFLKNFRIENLKIL